MRKYRKKTSKLHYDEWQMREAIKTVVSGKSIAGTTKDFQVPRSTLSKKFHLFNSKSDTLSSLEQDSGND